MPRAPAVILAIIPNLASWAQTLVDGALNAAGTSADKVGLKALAGSGLLLGGGAILAGMIHGAKLAIGESPQVALGYLLLALVCWAVAGRTREA